MSDRKQLFDGGWKFALGETTSASAVDFDDTHWRVLDLPHDWSIEGSIDRKNPTGAAGGYFPAGIGWYRKEFAASPSWQGKKVSLYFEGVYANAEVFINGTSLGVHPYGYTSFSYDVTPYLALTKKNVVAVRVDNAQQVNCRWYSGSGIYRHVWLFVTSPVHMSQWGTAITTMEVGPEKASVRVHTVVRNETSRPRTIIVSTELLDKNKKVVRMIDTSV